MTATNVLGTVKLPHSEEIGIALRCGLFKETPDGLIPARVAHVGDRILLIVGLTSRAASMQAVELNIELFRGDAKRHQLVRQISLDAQSSWTGGFRLHFGHGAGKSSRLACRVFVDGCLRAHRHILLDDHTIDAQGRFAVPNNRPASAATQVEFQDAIEALMRAARFSAPESEDGVRLLF